MRLSEVGSVSLRNSTLFCRHRQPLDGLMWTSAAVGDNSPGVSHFSACLVNEVVTALLLWIILSRMLV